VGLSRAGSGDPDRRPGAAPGRLPHTGLVGKYFNSLDKWAPEGYEPPGWDQFLAFRTRVKSGAYPTHRTHRSGPPPGIAATGGAGCPANGRHR